MKLSPIVLFTYKRLDTLIQTVETLQKNYLADRSNLFIFSDAARGEQDVEAVNNVRNYIKSITGFETVTIYESQLNKGLANSIIEGVSEILKIHETVIVLEDDLVSSSNFLSYMNQALLFYKNNDKVFSIAGYSIPIHGDVSESDVYFTLRSSSWGWATWKDRWSKIDWEVKDYAVFKNNKSLRCNFNKMGSDMSQMLDRQMQGKINSWAIRWCYHQFKYNLVSVHPLISKIENIGFNSPDASNTKERFNRYTTTLDCTEKTSFLFSRKFDLNPKMIEQFTRPFSIKARIKYKIINLFFKN
ncbi:sugar transferase [Flavobacterium sp. XS2P24]|uniref:sugar transferase n=1 Tax=Flavobacterium sp. XS2P24 TaxID=3041249 RepID=UPI0024A9A05F|nr:sugar transferase [Flavobacterium sp. XS2P24]MDI6049234.1 sugar transferase [Flavobacterium sp. XS2P24]